MSYFKFKGMFVLFSVVVFDLRMFILDFVKNSNLRRNRSPIEMCSFDICGYFCDYISDHNAIIVVLIKSFALEKKIIFEEFLLTSCS